MSLTSQYHDLLKKLSNHGEAGETTARSFADACLTLYETRATRLPKMLKGELHEGVSDAHIKLQKVAVKILADYPELQGDIILKSAAQDLDHTLITQMLTEVMWKAR